ncbi:MAG: hypothetical protein J5875_11625 [Paludibacteraceae bacterium]|nr:hypothetical protein [Paludibacteraceae bacterium]
MNTPLILVPLISAILFGILSKTASNPVMATLVLVSATVAIIGTPIASIYLYYNNPGTLFYIYTSLCAIASILGILYSLMNDRYFLFAGTIGATILAFILLKTEAALSQNIMFGLCLFFIATVISVPFVVIGEIGEGH